MSGYEKTLKGIVSLGYMDRSLADFAVAVRGCIETEQEKPNPDNALIATLCDAARVGWELIRVSQAKA